jgi:hypothetical protein
MILEGIVTTVNVDGSVNISPMGPVVDDERIDRLVLRPYQTSVTCQNLLRTRQGVFHVTDDVELIARAAVDRLDEVPTLLRCETAQGWILADACRWFAFEVREIDTSAPRARLRAEIVDRGPIRDFFGFNRAKHAVVEAAILATRTAILPAAEIAGELRRLAVLVEKTGGTAERRAFDFLDSYIREATGTLDAKEIADEPQPAAPAAGQRP